MLKFNVFEVAVMTHFAALRVLRLLN